VFFKYKTSKSQDMSAKVKETAKEEVERVRHLTEEAVRSGAYLYPLKVRQKKTSIG